MNLTIENYHSVDANRAYMSNSQFSDFLECPARAVAVLAGTFQDDDQSKALAIGSLVDAALLTPDRVSEVLEREKKWFFKRERKSKTNPEPPYTTEPTAAKEQADAMIARAKRDSLFMAALKGKTQTIVTFEMFGVMWKCALDVEDAVSNSFTDLKTTASITQTKYVDALKRHAPFYEVYNYWRQIALYREAFNAMHGKYPAAQFIAAISKEDPPDIGIFSFEDGQRIEAELRKIAYDLPSIMAYKNGEAAPRRCNACAYCRLTKVLGENAEAPVLARNMMPNGKEV